MATFAEGVKTALRAFPCFALANGQYAYGFAARIFPLTPAGAIADGIGGLRRLLGCDPVDDPLEPPPPFPGGQCPGVTYQITWTNITPGVGPVNNSINREGPLGLSTALQPGEAEADCGVPGRTFNRFTLTSPQGDVTLGSGCGVEVTNISPTRLDGQPDNCGSLPPPYPPPNDIDVDIDVTYNIEDGPDITVTVPFTFAPVNVDLSGNFSAPFTFNFGGLDFSGTLEISPEIKVNINPPTAPRGTGDGTDDLPTGDPNNDVEPVPVSEKVIGVAITSVLVGEQQLTTIATENIPAIYAPRAGSIKFAYSVGVSTFWSDDIDIKDDRTFIPCPFSQGADAVAVSPAPGVEVQWRAITGYPLATVNDLG